MNSIIDQIEKLYLNTAKLNQECERISIKESLSIDFLFEQLKSVKSRIQDILYGNIRCKSFDEVLSIVGSLRCFEDLNNIICVISIPSFNAASKSGLNDSLNILDLIFDKLHFNLNGNLNILCNSIMDIFEHAKLLSISNKAHLKGINVTAREYKKNAQGSVEDLILIEIEIGLKEIIKIVGKTDNHNQIFWEIRLGEINRNDVISSKDIISEDYFYSKASFESFQVKDDVVFDNSDIHEELSLYDIFQDKIIFRDLEPSSSLIRGLKEIRSSFNFENLFIPRKNQYEYALIVDSFINDICKSNLNFIIYIGDTIFNDGSVIYNLSKIYNNRILGFICNERPSNIVNDFIIGNIYYATKWRSLVNFWNLCRKRGYDISSSSLAIFDIDQTVYAAKGRDEESLKASRWGAINSYLSDIIPAYRYNAGNIEPLYRELDQDRFHLVTRDNMDNIVFLVLIVASGLYDFKEIEQFTTNPQNSIVSIIEDAQERVSIRSAHENLGKLTEEIRSIYYNTIIAKDPTPCKSFRNYECLWLASYMSKGYILDSKSTQDKRLNHNRIVLNMEVICLTRFLRENGCKLIALTDRPIESAIDDERDIDITKIKMPLKGYDIYNMLKVEHRVGRV